MRSLSAVLLALAALPVRAGEPTQRDLLNAVQGQLAELHKTAGPAVACVVVSRSDQYPNPAKPPEHAGKLGDFDPTAFLKDAPGKAALAAHLDLADPRKAANHTTAGGVVIDAAGLVLTTYQSIDGATKIYVHLPGGKGSYADIHAADSRCDLAVLKLLTPPPGLKPVKFGEVRFTDTADGRKATVFGGKLFVAMTLAPTANLVMDRPGGYLGALSNVPRRMFEQGKGGAARNVYAYGTLLELDPKLLDPKQSAGGSGCAIFNLDGELIGLTTNAVVPSAEHGPGYALPMDANTRRIVDVLRRGDEVEYGYLGVELLTQGRGFGVRDIQVTTLILNRVTPQSPAADAGLVRDDEITKIAGVPLHDYGDLLFQAGCALAGTKLKVTYHRGGREFNTELVLAKFPSDHPHLASARPDPVFGLRVDHGSVLAFRLAQNPRPFTSFVPPGVNVRELVPGSPAEKQFKALGEGPTRWLVTHVNGKAVTTPAEVYKTAKGQAAVKLTLLDPSNGNSTPRELTIP